MASSFLPAVSCPPAHPRRAARTAAGSTGDYVTGTPLPERTEGTSFLSSNVDRQQFRPIYFAFDSQTIESSENGKIQQIASFLQQGNSQIIIAGFTDERGTAEYNRGLGERRAESVREASIASGANAQNIQTVSFGAEMPADLRFERSKPGRRIAAPKSVWSNSGLFPLVAAGISVPGGSSAETSKKS